MRKQNVLINIALECDLARAGRSDDIHDTVDYRALKNEVVRVVGASRYFLIERLAARVAACCLADRRVKGARVTVDKPGALTKARSVAVEICRRRRTPG